MRRWMPLLLTCVGTGALVYGLMVFTSGKPGGPFDPPPADPNAKTTAVYDWQSSQDFVVAFGKVDVPRGSSQLSLPIPGRISAVHVQDGDHVAAGQPLVELDRKAAEADLLAASASVKEAEALLLQAQSRQQNYPLLIEQQKQVVTASQAALEVENRQLERLSGVGDKSVGSVFNLEVQQQRVVNQRAALESERLKLQQLERDNPALAVQAAQAAVERAKAQQSLAQGTLADRVLAAPSAGQILRINARVGEIVSPASSESLVWFVEDVPRIVRCEVNHRFAAKIKPGLAVECFRDDDDSLLAKGTVASISPWIADQRELTTKPFQRTDQRTLECIIALGSQPDPLWIGERIRVVVQTQAQAQPESSTSPVAPPAEPAAEPIQAER